MSRKNSRTIRPVQLPPRATLRICPATASATRPIPMPATMPSRMEETLTWTACLEPIDGKIVWMKAHGERWKEICWAVGLHRSAAHHHWQFGISVIALTLNKRRFNRNLSKQRVIELASGA